VIRHYFIECVRDNLTSAPLSYQNSGYATALAFGDLSKCFGRTKGQYKIAQGAKIIKDHKNQKKTTCYKEYNDQLYQKLLKKPVYITST